MISSSLASLWPPVAFRVGPVSLRTMLAITVTVAICVTATGTLYPTDLGTPRSTAALVIWCMTTLCASMGSIAVGGALFDDAKMGATVALPLVWAGLVPSPFLWLSLVAATLVCVYSTVIWQRSNITSLSLTSTTVALCAPAWLAAAFRIWIAR